MSSIIFFLFTYVNSTGISIRCEDASHRWKHSYHESKTTGPMGPDDEVNHRTGKDFEAKSCQFINTHILFNQALLVLCRHSDDTFNRVMSELMKLQEESNSKAKTIFDESLVAKNNDIFHINWLIKVLPRSPPDMFQLVLANALNKRDLSKERNLIEEHYVALTNDGYHSLLPSRYLFAPLMFSLLIYKNFNYIFQPITLNHLL